MYLPKEQKALKIAANLILNALKHCDLIGMRYDLNEVDHPLPCQAT